jgi:hypothetical protein
MASPYEANPRRLELYHMKRSKVDLRGGREAVSSEQISVFYGPGQQLSILAAQTQKSKTTVVIMCPGCRPCVRARIAKVRRASLLAPRSFRM